MTSHGFTASGLEHILSTVGVPKGSFYYYFASKEAWGRLCWPITTSFSAVC